MLSNLMSICSSSLHLHTQVSTVYNKAIATSNTDIIVNSVVVLFVMELDEWNFATIETCNEKWIPQVSDSEANSEADAGKGGAIEETRNDIELQRAQIADQQEELARQNDEIAVLHQTVQKLQESFT